MVHLAPPLVELPFKLPQLKSSLDTRVWRMEAAPPEVRELEQEVAATSTVS